MCHCGEPYENSSDIAMSPSFKVTASIFNGAGYEYGDSLIQATCETASISLVVTNKYAVNDVIIIITQ